VGSRPTRTVSSRLTTILEIPRPPVRMASHGVTLTPPGGVALDKPLTPADDGLLVEPSGL